MTRVDTARAEFYSRNGKLLGWFRPTGALRPNRTRWVTTEPMQAARIFVGFSVGEEPTWSMRDVMDLVREIRQEQGESPAASFVFQKGIYAHEDREGMVVEEDGAQVIVLNLTGDPERGFERQMETLATKLATGLRQEEVIVDFQRGGLSYKTMGVAA
jgi:hypothetical protein